MPCQWVYDLGMQRRSALKSMMAAFTAAFAGGSVTVEAEQPSGVTALRSTTMIETRDGTRLHFRDWGAGRPIVFVAPWGLCSDWWDVSGDELLPNGAGVA